MDMASPIPLLSSRRGCGTMRDVGLEQGFAAGFGEEMSLAQGQGPGQQSMKLWWMQNSFRQLLPRALVFSQTLVPLARTRRARRWHRSPPHLRPLAPYAGVWILTRGSSTAPSVQPGTGLFPRALQVEQSTSTLLYREAPAPAPAALCRWGQGTGISPKQSTERPNPTPKGQDPEHTTLTHTGMLTRG